MKFEWKKSLRTLRYAFYPDSGGGNGLWPLIFPKMNLFGWIRITVLVVASALIFRYLLMPCIISGASMEPTVKRIGLTFCWRGHYLFHKPERGDIAVIRYVGRKYFLKRIVALEGDTVEFRNGRLFVNGKAAEEPYVKFPSDWDLPPRRVEPGHIYVVGDNRSMPIGNHKFGSVSENRLVGVPLW